MPPCKPSLIAAASIGLLAQSQSATIHNESSDGDVDGLAMNLLTTPGYGTVLGSLDFGVSDGSDSAIFTGLTPGDSARATFSASATNSPGMSLRLNNNPNSTNTEFYNENQATTGVVSETHDFVVGSDGEVQFYLSLQEIGSLSSYSLTLESIPEPSTSALAGLASLALLNRRKRK